MSGETFGSRRSIGDYSFVRKLKWGSFVRKLLKNDIKIQHNNEICDINSDQIVYNNVKTDKNKDYFPKARSVKTAKNEKSS